MQRSSFCEPLHLQPLSSVRSMQQKTRLACLHGLLCVVLTSCFSVCEITPCNDIRTCCRAAAAFYYSKDGPITVAYISDAYRLLSPAVGTVAAKIIFGIALLASGQNSTITGTLAGDLLGSQPLTSLTCFNSCWSRLMGEWAYVQGKW